MQINWISRPNLPPLGLDLADFGSRGAFQFGGHTSEGRPIYARYRMGWLTLMLEDPKVVLLETNIGPAYHGSMLPEQVCDLAGMTLNGVAPAVSAKMLKEAQQQEDILDWSGATMYWKPQLQISKSGADALTLAVNEAARDHNIHISMRSRSPNARIIEHPKHFDRPTLLAETISGTLHINVATTDTDGRRFLERFASEFLFNRIDVIELATEIVTDTREAGVCFSRDLINWCAAGPDRYLMAHQSGDPPRMIGVRPAHDLERLSASRA